MRNFSDGGVLASILYSGFDQYLDEKYTNFGVEVVIGV